ncbi:unnamed protein product [Chrysodeixis includens]|uniref:Peptidase S1 domain-containing protein n=1 Tax=Chrysodeixis includens TaxID=689277 RepID=A0A9P0C2I5_CHRIL|nr:unnamed protein product [Chrysodeixis includens]
MFSTLILWSLFVISASGSKCDGANCNVNSRIVQGQISEQNVRPYQIALYSRVGTTGELGFCGGSLLSQEWLVTAAHCCFHNGDQVDHVQAILGAHSLYDRYENGRRVLNVAEVVVHPAYDASTFANDIALLRLANVVQITDTVQPVQLPYRSIATHNFAGFAATVSGWGIAADGAPYVSPLLRQKQMTVITDPLCNRSLFNQLTEHVICGSHESGGTCKGDNGGPMTIVQNEIDILVGVASFVSANGCNTNMPSVFTRVQRYLDWISEVTGVPILD